MIKITKNEFDKLNDNNLINYSENNKNFTRTCGNKKSKRKRYYVVPTKEVLICLGYIKDTFSNKKKSQKRQNNNKK